MENLMRFDVTNERNLTMLVDFYELTMAIGYFNKGVEDRIAYFDMYFRRVPGIMTLWKNWGNWRLLV